MDTLKHDRVLRVMVVDESRDRAELLTHALAGSGHEIISYASSTFNLHQQVEALQPDVIVIDTESPDRDTLEHLCLVSRNQPRPIVMFTHDDDSGKIREAVRAGVNAYVVDGLSTERISPIIDVAIARFQEYQALRQELQEANTKLAERKDIDRAKGILMKSRKLSEDEAYRALRKLAMDKNLRIGEVAQQVISVAELLG
jgi:response regulator NasT